MKLGDLPLGAKLASAVHDALPPSQRLHLILLGVADVACSTEFYEALGWTRSPTGHDGFVKFDLGGYALCLLPREALAKDVGVNDGARDHPSSVAFVYLTKTVSEVARILAQAELAGGTVVKPATRTEWGVAGYFRDPDGHLFEVDYEECWVFDEAGALVVDELNT